jgi:hypothetical protein
MAMINIDTFSKEYPTDPLLCEQLPANVFGE